MNLQELIKAELKKKGLPEGFSAFINVENENEIEGAVNKLFEIHQQSRPGSFDEWLQSNPNFQSEFDRRLNQGISTRTENLQKQIDKLKGQGGQGGQQGQDGNGGQGGNGNGSPNSEVSELRELVVNLTKKIDEQATARTVESRQAQAVNKLKEAGLSEKLIKFIDVSKDDIDEQIKDLSETFEQGVQSEIKKNYSGYRPMNPETPHDMPNTVIDGFVENKAKEIK